MKHYAQATANGTMTPGRIGISMLVTLFIARIIHLTKKTVILSEGRNPQSKDPDNAGSANALCSFLPRNLG
jgi:hypothetical protein